MVSPEEDESFPKMVITPDLKECASILLESKRNLSIKLNEATVKQNLSESVQCLWIVQ